MFNFRIKGALDCIVPLHSFHEIFTYVANFNPEANEKMLFKH